MSTGCQKDRKTDRQTDGQTDRKTDRQIERLFSLVVKTKVLQKVSQSDRKIYSAPGRQTERQNDSMADSRSAKEPAFVILF